MYKLYVDKNELFEASIELYGASFSDTSARLVMKTDQWDLVFEGKVNPNGKIEIPIKKLKNILPEGLQGNLKLEVIADDTYFTPWQDSFELLRSKNVTVEVNDNVDKKNIIKESVKSVNVKRGKSNKTTKITESIAKPYLREIMIANNQLMEGRELKNKVKTITDKFVKEHNLTNEAKRTLYGMVRELNETKKTN